MNTLDISGHKTMSRRSLLRAAILGGAIVSLAPVLGSAAPAFAAGVGAATFLKTLPPSSHRYLNTYRDVFKGSQFLSISTVVNPKDKRIKILYCSAAEKHQFQVIDFASGKVEYTFSNDSGIASNFGIDEKNGIVYFGLSNGNLLEWNFTDKKVVFRGKPYAKARAMYDIKVDENGDVWGGTYPNASIWKYVVKSRKFTSYAKLDSESTYARTLAVGAGKVYATTGSLNPKIYMMDVANPNGTKKMIKFPETPATGFASQSHVRGDKYLVTSPKNNKHMEVFDLKTGKYVKRVPVAAFNGSHISGSEKDSVVYGSAGKNLVRLDTKKVEVEIIAEIAMESPRAFHVSDNSVYVIGNDMDNQGLIEKFSLSTKKRMETRKFSPTPSPFSLSSLLAMPDGNIYFGGFRSDGIGSLNPNTGETWRNPPNTGIVQIEHMAEYEGNIFVGSYPGAKLFRFRDPTEGRNATRRIGSLHDSKYNESRPFAWGFAGGYAVVGTVPNYGLRGGAIAMIDLKTNKIMRVKEKIVPDQSIVGLHGQGDIVYGTTSPKPGLGATVPKSDAVVFAYNVKTDKMLWSTSIPKEYGLYSPMVIDGRLIVSSARNLFTIDTKTGRVTRTYMVEDRVDGPGWSKARSIQIPGTKKIVFNNVGNVYIINLDDSTKFRIASDSKSYTNMAVTKDGRVFMQINGTDIVELDTRPTKTMTIKSDADLLMVNDSSQLMIKYSDGRRNWGEWTKISDGWDKSTILSIHAIDWDNDGVRDIIVQRNDGFLYLHKGMIDGGFDNQRKLKMKGWSGHKFTIGRLLPNQVHPQIVSVDSKGRLLRYQVNRSLELNAWSIQGSSGWTGMQVGICDLYGNGKPTIFAKKNSQLWRYNTNGNGKMDGPKTDASKSDFGGINSLTFIHGHYGNRPGVILGTTSGKKIRYLSWVDENGVFGGISDTPGNFKNSVIVGSARQ